MSEPRKTDVPHDRLTRLCAVMTDALEADPEFQGEKAIVFIDSDVDGVGGLVLHGYDDDTDALAAIFMHLQAIFKANGKDLMFAPLPGSPQDN